MSKATYRTLGGLAIFFGSVGILICVAAFFGSIWYGVESGRTVNRVTGRIEAPIKRVENRLQEVATAASTTGSTSELRSKAGAVSEAASSATSSMTAITEHPLYERLPVDTTGLTQKVDSVNNATESLSKTLNSDEPIEQLRGPIKTEVTNAENLLQSATGQLDAVASQLTRWLRLSAALFAIMSTWGLIGQFALVRWGRSLMRG